MELDLEISRKLCSLLVCFNVFQDQFHRHLLLEAERRQLRPIIENKSRIILAHTSSGYKYGLLVRCHVLTFLAKTEILSQVIRSSKMLILYVFSGMVEI